MANNQLWNRWIESFKDWLGLRLPDCRNITPLLSESVDGPVGPWRRLMIRLHLFTCDRCGRYLDQIRFMSRAIRSNSERLSNESCADGCQLADPTKQKLKDVLAASTAIGR